MLTYEAALSLLLERIPAPVPIRVPLQQALDRVLAETVRADRDLPPFDKSCVDGFALLSDEVERAPRRLRVSGTFAAGPLREPGCLECGEAARIMTGAPLPEGADAVQMVERTRVENGWVEILASVSPEENVARQASEVRRGEIVLEAGRLLSAPEIAILATFGYSRVHVFKAPVAAVLSTGNELVSAGEAPGSGQIRNSNSPMLVAQCRRSGVDAKEFPPLPDDPERIRRGLKTAIRDYDLVIITGGVSMGDFDFVHTVLREEGIDVLFHKAAIKPGKPLMLGRTGDTLVFGLPGNPVSSYVTFEIFAKPAIRKWLGYPNVAPRPARALLNVEVRHKPGRLFFMPAVTCPGARGLEVEALETRGSSDIVAFSRADSLLLVPSETDVLPAGSAVDVILLDHWHTTRGFREPGSTNASA